MIERIVFAAVLVCGGVAHAQPAPKPAPSGDKVDAKSLMQSGLKLLENKDYLGALSVFKSAYARFPSAKILLNIGTTMKLLDRDADAANAYQLYLDSRDVDATKRAEVEAAIAGIDKTVGMLEITVTPADAEIQINADAWIPAAKFKRYRVPAGTFTIAARKPKFQNEAKQAQIAAGETAPVSLALVAIPEAAPRIVEVPVIRDSDIRAESDTRSRIGVLALAHLDIPRGGAALVGATGDITEQLQLQAAVIIGPTADSDVTLSGAFAGAGFAFMTGDFRPTLVAGMPVFFSNGARYAIRGAAGIEYQINKHISVIGELGLEYVFNAEMGYQQNVFVPGIGAAGRL